RDTGWLTRMVGEPRRMMGAGPRQAPFMPTPSFKAINRASILAAGPRYTPGIDPDAPNLAITPLRLIMSGLAYDDGLAAHIGELAAEVESALKNADRYVARRFAGRRSTPRHFADAVRGLSTPGPAGVRRRFQRLTRMGRFIRRALRSLIDAPLE